MHTPVCLRIDRNEFYLRSAKDPDGSWVKRKVITAQGFARLNTWIGVTFSSPSTMQIGERVVGNPYIEREGKSVQRVSARRIGIARNAAGSLTAVDLTVTYDLDDYLVGEVWSRWQPNRRKPKPSGWGRVVGDYHATNPESHEKVIECPGGIYLVVNLLDKEVMDLWSAHLQRQKFAERNAVSICERNIMKRFVGVSYASEDGMVNIVHWPQPDRNYRQFEEIADRVQKGEAIIDGEDVQVEQASEVIDSQEAREALYGEGEDAPEFQEEEAEQEDAGLLMDQLRNAWAAASPDKRIEAMDGVGMEQKEIRNCEDPEILRKIIDTLGESSS